MKDLKQLEIIQKQLNKAQFRVGVEYDQAVSESMDRCSKTADQGFVKAHEKKQIPLQKELVYDNLNHYMAIEKAVDHAIHQKADCLVCMDDSICLQVLKKLRRDGIKVPRDIKVASFFGSNLLEGFLPSITSVDFANDEVGIIAAKTILSIIDGEEDIPRKIELGYEISMKESTK